MDVLRDVITDTHYDAPDRKGRHVVVFGEDAYGLVDQMLKELPVMSIRLCVSTIREWPMYMVDSRHMMTMRTSYKGIVR